MGLRASQTIVSHPVHIAAMINLAWAATVKKAAGKQAHSSTMKDERGEDKEETFAQKIAPLAEKITKYINDHQDDAAQEDRWRTTMKREAMKRFREQREAIDTQGGAITEVRRAIDQQREATAEVHRLIVKFGQRKRNNPRTTPMKESRGTADIEQFGNAQASAVACWRHDARTRYRNGDFGVLINKAVNWVWERSRIVYR